MPIPVRLRALSACECAFTGGHFKQGPDQPGYWAVRLSVSPRKPSRGSNRSVGSGNGGGRCGKFWSCEADQPLLKPCSLSGAGTGALKLVQRHRGSKASTKAQGVPGACRSSLSLGHTLRETQR
eukprot:scaffold36805_cov18-Tisochrysis_lutea.AAC.1